MRPVILHGIACPDMGTPEQLQRFEPRARLTPMGPIIEVGALGEILDTGAGAGAQPTHRFVINLGGHGYPPLSSDDMKAVQRAFEAMLPGKAVVHRLELEATFPPGGSGAANGQMNYRVVADVILDKVTPTTALAYLKMHLERETDLLAAGWRVIDSASQTLARAGEAVGTAAGGVVGGVVGETLGVAGGKSWERAKGPLLALGAVGLGLLLFRGLGVAGTIAKVAGRRRGGPTK